MLALGPSWENPAAGISLLKIVHGKEIIFFVIVSCSYGLFLNPGPCGVTPLYSRGAWLTPSREGNRFIHVRLYRMQLRLFSEMKLYR